MKRLLLYGAPLIAFTWFGFFTDFFTLPDENPGIVHFAGVPMGGMFELNTKTYVCDENGNNCTLVKETTETGEIEDLEFELQGIEYREGASASYNKTKQPGLSKYTNIQMRSPLHYDFDFGEWKFRTFQEEEPTPDLTLPDIGDDIIDQRLREQRQPEPKPVPPQESAMEELEIQEEELSIE